MADRGCAERRATEGALLESITRQCIKKIVIVTFTNITNSYGTDIYNT